MIARIQKKESYLKSLPTFRLSVETPKREGDAPPQRKTNGLKFKGAGQKGHGKAINRHSDAAPIQLLGVAIWQELTQTPTFTPELRNRGAGLPRMWLDVSRVQPLCARTLSNHSELLRAFAIFREGAENSTRGACAPQRLRRQNGSWAVSRSKWNRGLSMDSMDF